DDALHENVQKNSDGEADTARDHAGFDFVVTPYFRRDAPLMLKLCFTPLPLCFRKKHLGDPGFTPIELLICLPRIHDLADSIKICSTRFTEFQFVALIRTASWAEHRF